MEGRKLNISFSKTGNGYDTTRISLPITELRDMGVTQENRQVNYMYCNENDLKFMILSKEDLSGYEIIIKKK